MVKRKKISKDPHRKMFPASCGHKIDDINNHLEHNQYDGSKCSQAARYGCKTCILHYVYTVYKKHPDSIDGAKTFVSECVIYGAQEKKRSIDEVFELLQLCYFAGLGFSCKIFLFENRYTEYQLIWLLTHGASPVYINLVNLVTQEKWKTILLVGKILPRKMWSEMCEILLSLTTYMSSSLLSIILFYVDSCY